MHHYGLPLRSCLYLALSLAGMPYTLSAQETSAAAVQGEEVTVEEAASALAFARRAPEVTAASVGSSASVVGAVVADDAYIGVADSGSTSSSRQVSSYPVPWVEATRWQAEETPHDLDDLDVFEWHLFRFEAWDLFPRRPLTTEDLNVPPEYAGELPIRSAFRVGPPYETPLARKLKKLGRKKMHQEIRRAVKRQWRNQFRDSNMSYSQYRGRMVQIRNIGRDPQQFDDLDADFNTDEVRENLFERQYRDGEREFPLLTLGPLTVTDTGSLYFDLGLAGERRKLSLAKDKDERRPFLVTKDYRIDTRFKFDISPHKALGKNPVYFVDSYGFTIDVDILSDVLGREMVTAEFELEVDDHRDVAAFFNFVVKSRK